MEDAPGDHADGHAHHAHRRRQEQRPADDREVVDDRGEHRGREPAARVEDAGRHRAERQEDRAEEHEPGQLDGRGELGRVEARRDHRHDGPGRRRRGARPARRAQRSIRFVTVDTTRQARSASPRASSVAMIGIRADARAPAATSWKIRSGIRNAAKNASRRALDPERGPDDDEPDPAEHARDEDRRP